MSIYTHSDWVRDKNFSAQPGQEIDEEIYWEMYDVMPIYSMPRRRDTAGYDGGFMVSEPHSTDEKGEFKYSTFAQKNGRFFFLGNMTRESTTKFKEIFSLRRALKFAGIPHKFKDESIRIIKGEVNFLMIEKYHILYPQEPFILSAVEGDGTYGADSDKIEIMGLLTEEEKKTDRVVGWLDADDVFRRIKEHWESVKME